MSMLTTLALLGLSLAVIGLANWRERRPKDIQRLTLVSYPLIQMIGVVVALLMIAHLVSLLTGQPLHGRRMP